MTDTPTPTQSTRTKDPLWAEVLAGAFNHDDDTWHLGEGGEWLLDLLIELMHPSDVDVDRVTRSQLQAALEATQQRWENR